MKIYINRRPVSGPWGGGSKVVAAIVKECHDRGHEVFFEEDIRKHINMDVYFCIDPRPKETVTYEEILRSYQRNASSKLIHRIGDLGTHGKPELFQIIKNVVNFSDLVIFPSQWSKDYAKFDNIKKSIIIQNAPSQVFIDNKKTDTFSGNLNIVTHHWSDNKMKGFDIYQRLDEYCTRKDNIKFTFIGRKPPALHLRNHILPLDVDGLVKELPKHSVYLTASRQEAGANHVLEAMALGLPVIYHEDGGSIVEYCKDFGIQYHDFNDLIEIIEQKQDQISSIYSNKSITRGIAEMANEYVRAFELEHES